MNHMDSVRIVVTDPRQIAQVEKLAERAPWADFVPVEEERLPDVIRDADILLGRITRETLRSAEQLRWVHVNSAGVNYLPLDTLQARGILLTNGRGLHGNTIGDHVMALVLAHSRELMRFEQRRRARDWDRECNVRELAGATMGIVGLGGIGRAVAARARAFEMRVVGANRSGAAVAGVDTVYPINRLNEMLAATDYLVLACPLTDESRKLIGSEQLRALPRGSHVVNIARGEVIDEAALVEALRDGHIAGAGLDVFEEEPLPQDSPLWDLPGVILTPHVAGRQSRAGALGAERFLHNLDRYRKGCTLDFLVDYDKGY